MRKTILLTLSVLIAGSVMADDKEENTEREEPRAVRGAPIEISGVAERMKQQFSRMDEDGDGELTLAELSKMRGADGRGGFPRGNERAAAADREARRAQRQESLKKRAQEMLTKYDADASSALNVEEFTKTRVEPLENMDTNKDGKVTREEMRAGRQAQESF